MDFLKNVPDTPKALADLIEIRDGRVVSMSLTRSDESQMMLLAVSAGEAVTAEQYPGDMFYYVIEGTMPLLKGGETYELRAGDCMAVEAGAPHAIGGGGGFKVLQVMWQHPGKA